MTADVIKNDGPPARRVNNQSRRLEYDTTFVPRYAYSAGIPEAPAPKEQKTHKGGHPQTILPEQQEHLAASA